MPPGSADTPLTLDALTPAWRPAVVPGTVATMLRQENGGELDLERVPDLDAVDWWYRCHASAELPAAGERVVLCFDGLATLADVWVNGSPVLNSENMFIRHEVDITGLVGVDTDIVIRFRSLRAALDSRRPRPRWRTKLVEHQQLRWHRTTLLGRMPGWSPPVRAVGPWRAVRLERRTLCEIVAGDLVPSSDATTNVVRAAVTVRPIGSTTIRGATLVVGDQRVALTVSSPDGLSGDVVISGTLTHPMAERWWPHTHGAQPRYDARVVVQTSGGDTEIGFGAIGFRQISADRSNDGFAVAINGTPVFCRGACWTTPDVVSLSAPASTYRALLVLARDAGMNMIRVGGTMVYESDAFYDLCDELGILVWQDFMFANMDYPAADSAFATAVGREVDDVLARLSRHPSLAVLCGNSEVEQQTAMLGMDRELWTNSIFSELLPSACAVGASGIPYLPSSPTGGVLPFHVDVGVSHYFGVGAYLRPLDDARRSNVRFTSECLGFSNVPEPAMVDALLPNGESAFHHPRWKARVPRDHGPGWDFEDVRDHYLVELFGVDPMRLRYADIQRYLALSRIVTAEVMARTIGEWRRAGSTCRGAIVWFFQDLWAGAGWGVVDSTGRPKAAYYGLKRAMQPVAVAITDEGANGLYAHVANDRSDELHAVLDVAMLRGASTIVVSKSTRIVVPGRGSSSIAVDDVVGGFHDSAYAFRFGPPGHDAVIVTLRDHSGAVLSEAVQFTATRSTARTDDVSVSAHARQLSAEVVEIVVKASRFADSVAIDCGDYIADDNYFHIAPGTERTVIARAARSGAKFTGFVQPLNSHDGVRIVMSNADVASGAPAG